MIIKEYKPLTPSTRHLRLIRDVNVWKGNPQKALSTGLRKQGGRNVYGHTTVHHRGGGHKQKYRQIDFKRNVTEEQQLIRKEYDPNRTSYIGLLRGVTSGKFAYMLLPQALDIGTYVTSGDSVALNVGNTLPLRNIPIGTFVHNIELIPGNGGKLSRAAGTYSQLLKKTDEGQAMLRLTSGELHLVSLDCHATIGILSNVDHNNVNYGKAGRMRWLGHRPVVRGTAKNPVDHPHGGGAARSGPGRPSCSPWGIPTKGKRTRHNIATDKFIVQRRS